MSPGRLLYLAYHRPREAIENFVDQALRARRDSRMRAAALRLLPFESGCNTPTLPPVRFLTGDQFAHQTAFCARSLEHAAGRTFQFEFFDDGTLAPVHCRFLRNLFPNSTIISATTSAAAAHEHVPARLFPALHHARSGSPLMRKLIDLRAGRNGPALYLDSDMLFFAPPTELLTWLQSPSTPLHMAESSPGAYVDTPSALAERWGRPLPAGFNTGILALDDSMIDWPALEAAADALAPESRVHKWAEQTLTAWLFGGLSAVPLDRLRYRVCASRADLAGPPPVLRHYVHKAKMPYLAGEWDFLAAPT